MLSCYRVHYLINKETPAFFDVLAHSECNAVQLMWRYGKTCRPDDYLTYFFYDCRVDRCGVELITYLSPSYIKGIEKGLPGY